MVRDVIIEAQDVNEAVEKGALELGLSSEEVEFEILSMPRRGFLGIKKYPAKVRVFVEEEDIVIPKSKVKERNVNTVERKNGEKQTDKVREKKQNNFGERKQNKNNSFAEKKETVKSTEKTVEKENLDTAKPQSKENNEENNVQVKQETYKNYVSEKTDVKIEIEPNSDVKEKAEKASEFLNDVMKKMGYDNVTSSPVYYSDCVNLVLDGEDAGSVIGYRGETLDALQYLSSLVANRGEGEYLRLNINSGNYREKREKTLIGLAKRLAKQAIRTGKSITLEPMNPYERRVIHGAVAEIKGATSTSEGLDPNRYVVISSVSGVPSEEFADRKHSGAGRNYRNKSQRGGKRPYNKDNRSKTNYKKAQSETIGEQQGETAKKIDDSELIKNVTLGVPLVNGEKSAPKKSENTQPKKQIDGNLYGKIM